MNNAPKLTPFVYKKRRTIKAYVCTAANVCRTTWGWKNFLLFIRSRQTQSMLYKFPCCCKWAFSHAGCLTYDFKWWQVKNKPKYFDLFRLLFPCPPLFTPFFNDKGSSQNVNTSRIVSADYNRNYYRIFYGPHNFFTFTQIQYPLPFYIPISWSGIKQ